MIRTSEIKDVAERVREIFEKKKLRPRSREVIKRRLSRLPLEESRIDEMINKAVEQFPREACIIASLYLNIRLRHRGLIVIGSYQEKPHTYIVLDGVIVDITADQFGGPRVYVGPIKEPWD